MIVLQGNMEELAGLNRNQGRHDATVSSGSSRVRAIGFVYAVERTGAGGNITSSTEHLGTGSAEQRWSASSLSRYTSEWCCPRTSYADPSHYLPFFICPTPLAEGPDLMLGSGPPGPLISRAIRTLQVFDLTLSVLPPVSNATA